MSLNIRKNDWSGILLYWLFEHVDEMILHDPTRYYDQSLIINAKNEFCKYEYTKIQGNGDFENVIKKIQSLLEPCLTPTDIYKAICALFYTGRTIRRHYRGAVFRGNVEEDRDRNTPLRKQP